MFCDADYDRFGYCIQVYLRSLMDDTSSTQNSSGLPSYSNSVRTVPTARQAYRRVRKVLMLQWRGIFIVMLIVVDVVFFAIVFVYMDNATQSAKNDVAKAQPWLLCLVTHAGDKNACLDLAKGLVLSEATVIAVLILLSTNGIWLCLLLGRWSMVTGWVALIHSKFHRSNDFVSVDARRLSADPRTYEMLASTPQPAIKSPDSLMTTTASPVPAFAPMNKEANEVDYFGREARFAPSRGSFSSPKAPTKFQRPEQTPITTPISEAGGGSAHFNRNKI